MRRSIIRLIIGAPLALVAVGAGAAAAVPGVRHIVSALWHTPERLPTLPDNIQVHYQPGADEYARAVSARLPAAIARVEAVHGRPFAHAAPIGVYSSSEAYEAANGHGSSRPVGVTLFGRVVLSPVLHGAQRQRLPAILTHELSHAHIQGWISGSAYMRLPSWFKEGLAVMISEGGGAELVSEQEARTAIQRGEHIAIEDRGSPWSVSISFERPPRRGPPWRATVLAYRQAGMFVAYLRESDEAAFARMMNAILDGRSFVEAVDLGYHADVQSLWQRFVRTSAEAK